MRGDRWRASTVRCIYLNMLGWSHNGIIKRRWTAHHNTSMVQHSVVLLFPQDVDISLDPADSCSLFITVHSHSVVQKRPALSAQFHFEDHIRCNAARQCLLRSKDHLRLAKMTRITKLLHLPSPPEPPVPESFTVSQGTSILQPLSLNVPPHVMPTVFSPPSSSPPASQRIEMANLQPYDNTSNG